MWREFFRMDVRYLLRQPTLWVAAALFGALAVGAYWLPEALLRSQGASTLAAPVNLGVVLGMMCVLATFVLSGLLARTALRDSEANTLALLMATPLRPRDYLAGRMAAGFACSFGLFAVTGLALAAAATAATPGAAFLGVLGNTVQLLVLQVAPNLLFLAVFVQVYAWKTRSLSSVYGGIVVFFLLWAVSVFPVLPLDAADQKVFAAMLDPFGTRALSHAASGVPEAQLNLTAPLALPGIHLVLANRAVWALICLATLAWAGARFQPLATPRTKRRQQTASAPYTPRGSLPAPAFTGLTPWRQGMALAWFDVKRLQRSTAFRILLGMGVLLLGAALFQMNGGYGARSLLTTGWVISTLQDHLPLLTAIAALVLATELFGKAHEAHTAELEAALPVAESVRWAAALAALALVLLGYAACLGLAAWLTQQMTEPAFDGLAWSTWLALQAIEAFLLAALAVAVHGLSRDRFMAFALFALVLVGGKAAGWLLPDQAHWAYAHLPSVRYSDLAGFGAGLAAWGQAAAGWSLVAMLAVLLAFQVKRGAGARLPALGLALLLGGAYAMAGYANRPTLAPAAIEALRARYELAYAQYRHIAQPRVHAIHTEVDLYPEQQRAVIRGQYALTNVSGVPVTRLYVTVNPTVVTTLTMPQARLVLDDTRTGFQVLELARPLAAGARTTLAFETRIAPASAPTHPVTKHGAVLNNHDYYPQIGYLARIELTDPTARQRHGLAPKSAARGPLSESQLEGNAGWVEFSAVLSTQMGQSALTSGDLVRNWTRDGRAFFEYKARSRILPHFSVISGTYEKHAVSLDGVALHFYYDARHGRNLAKWADATGKAVSYYRQHVGEYPHAALRLVEVPGQQSSAQSFPGMITFTESSALNHSSGAADQPDPLMFLVAHEVAHQWWGNELLGANLPGAELLTETMAQHGAMALLRKHGGKPAYLKALEIEKQRYLHRPRTGDPERSLLESHSQDRSVAYHKGALVFAELEQQFGERRWQELLQLFYRRHRHASDPHPTARDFLQFVCRLGNTGQCSAATRLLSSAGPATR